MSRRAIEYAVAEELASTRVVLTQDKLLTPHGEIPIEYLSSGSFAVVYREVEPTGRVFAVVGADNHDKDIATVAHQVDPTNPHLPAVYPLGSTPTGRKVYEMPYYEPFHFIAPRDALALDAFERCASDAYYELIGDEELLEYRRPTSREKAALALECAERSAEVSPRMLDAIRGLLEAASLYPGSYAFDLPARNVASDEHGNLVLLDVLAQDDEEES